MTKFIKRLLYILCTVIIISGAVLFGSGAGDFFKINFSEPIDINDVDSSKFTKNTLVSGDVYYVIDSIASSYSTAIFNNTKTVYYLIPIKCGKYILVATGNSNEINMFDRIFQQTSQYLNKEIEDTFTSTTINGKVFPIDDDLQELLYSWCDDTNYFSTTDRSAIDEQVLPYVIYTQNWGNIQTLTIVGISMIVVGVIILLIVVKIAKKSNR